MKKTKINYDAPQMVFFSIEESHVMMSSANGSIEELTEIQWGGTDQWS